MTLCAVVKDVQWIHTCEQGICLSHCGERGMGQISAKKKRGWRNLLLAAVTLAARVAEFVRLASSGCPTRAQTDLTRVRGFLLRRISSSSDFLLMPLEGQGVPLVLSGVMMRDAFLGITSRASRAWAGRRRVPWRGGEGSYKLTRRRRTGLREERLWGTRLGWERYLKKARRRQPISAVAKRPEPVPVTGALLPGPCGFARYSGQGSSYLRKPYCRPSPCQTPPRNPQTASSPRGRRSNSLSNAPTRTTTETPSPSSSTSPPTASTYTSRTRTRLPYRPRANLLQERRRDCKGWRKLA